MSADIQHADAVKALEAIKKMLSVDPADRMTYADLCVALAAWQKPRASRASHRSGDLAGGCSLFFSPIALSWHFEKVRTTKDGGYNESSFAAPHWKGHKKQLAQIAAAHVWTDADFDRVAERLRDLGDDGTHSLRERISSGDQSRPSRVALLR